MSVCPYISVASAEGEDLDVSSDSDWHLVVRIVNLHLFVSQLSSGRGATGVWLTAFFTWPPVKLSFQTGFLGSQTMQKADPHRDGEFV